MIQPFYYTCPSFFRNRDRFAPVEHCIHRITKACQSDPPPVPNGGNVSALSSGVPQDDMQALNGALLFLFSVFIFFTLKLDTVIVVMKPCTGRWSLHFDDPVCYRFVGWIFVSFGKIFAHVRTIIGQKFKSRENDR